MEHTEYADMVAALVAPGTTLRNQITPTQMHHLHMVVGISGEAGELLDAIKKHTVYQKPLDIVNVVEELGDIEFYMEGLRQGLGITRDAVLAANVYKLSKRYPNKAFSTQAAITRADKE